MSMHFTQQRAVRRVNEHRICMNFMPYDGWHISFLENCRTPLPFKLTFACSDKILEMCVIWLRLTRERYAKLKWSLARC